MKRIKVNNVEEFQELFDCSIRQELSLAVVDTIIKNLATKVKSVKVAHISIVNPETEMVLALERNEFLDTLEQQLKDFETAELYEHCSKIYDAIKKLKIGKVIHDVQIHKKSDKKNI